CSACWRFLCVLFFSSRRRHTRFSRDWSSDVCSSDLAAPAFAAVIDERPDEFGPFNLLAFDGVRLAFASNRPTASNILVAPGLHEIGRASCRERVEVWVAAEVGTQRRWRTDGISSSDY